MNDDEEDDVECPCGNPISVSTAHVPCVDCGRHIMVAVDEQAQRWRCGRCGNTPIAEVGS
jgi:ribosomal protein S27AE